jgi:2-oxoglutarate ferredoxin oxidoreductase subunit beta
VARTPVGIFRDVTRPTYDDLARAQVQHAVDTQGEGELAALLAGGDTWTVD